MTHIRRATEQVKHGIGAAQDALAEATDQAAPVLEALARFGYISKGVVYGMLGFLALSVALGHGGATTDTKGALLRLEDLPGGPLLMWLLVLGLLGYALWQLLRGLLDAEQQGIDGKGLAKRAGYTFSGLLNLSLAWFAAQLALKGKAQRNQDSEAELAQQVLSFPGGQFMLGLVGLALIGIAGKQMYSAYGGKFMKSMAFTSAGAPLRDKLKRIGQVGIISRAFLMLLIGLFAISAAIRNRATVAGGISEVLTWLREQSMGNLLLGAVAVGTLFYAFWSFVQAKYRRIRIG